MRFGGLRELIVLFPRLAGLIARLVGDPQVPARVAAWVPRSWKARVFGPVAA